MYYSYYAKIHSCKHIEWVWWLTSWSKELKRKHCQITRLRIKINNIKCLKKHFEMTVRKATGRNKMTKYGHWVTCSWSSLFNKLLFSDEHVYKKFWHIMQIQQTLLPRLLVKLYFDENLHKVEYVDSNFYFYYIWTIARIEYFHWKTVFAYTIW